jgi:hypothetical protein
MVGRSDLVLIEGGGRTLEDRTQSHPTQSSGERKIVYDVVFDLARLIGDTDLYLDLSREAPFREAYWPRVEQNIEKIRMLLMPTAVDE